jgi:hypothetical protein
MKWVVATVGGLLVTVGAFLAIMLIPSVAYPALYKSMPALVALYVVGVPLAIAAGVLSFRATLRQYAKKGN